MEADRRVLRGEGGTRSIFAPTSFGLIDYYEDWYDEDGFVVRDAPDVGRTDPYPCGSGVKYKFCCG